MSYKTNSRYILITNKISSCRRNNNSQLTLPSDVKRIKITPHSNVHVWLLCPYNQHTTPMSQAYSTILKHQTPMYPKCVNTIIQTSLPTLT